MRSEVFIWLITIFVTRAAVQLPVFRLVQFEQDNTPYGSQVASLNFLGAHYENTAEVPRKIALISALELSVDTLQNLLKLKPSGILIILPDSATVLSSDFLAKWKELEIYLASNSFPFPIYFTQDSSEVQQVYAELRYKTSSGTDDDQLNLMVTTEEKAVLRKLQLENMYGFIYEYSEDLPVVALVTHYDAYSITPDLTSASQSTLSGLIATLQISKAFNELFEKSAPGYNLLVLFTSAGPFNFQGARDWLSAEDGNIQQIISKISFALCIDNLGGGSDLFMHISRFHKEGEDEVIKFYSAFNTTASETSKHLSYIKKKVNMGDPYVPWQHENFARRRVVSATLSTRSTPFEKIVEYGSLFDTPQQLDTQVLRTNIQFLYEALARFIYGESKLALNTEVVSEEDIKNWVERIGNYTYFTSKVKTGSSLNNLLFSSLESYSGLTAQRKSFTLEDFTLYNSKPETLTIQRVKPAILEFYIFLAVLAYITALWGLFKVIGGVRFGGKPKQK
jgi:hypothetical protein